MSGLACLRIATIRFKSKLPCPSGMSPSKKTIRIIAECLILEMHGECERREGFDPFVRIVEQREAVAGIDRGADELAAQVLVERQALVDALVFCDSPRRAAPDVW